jgi:hypothetical protein
MREYEACGQYKTRERLPHMVCVCVLCKVQLVGQCRNTQAILGNLYHINHLYVYI